MAVGEGEKGLSRVVFLGYTWHVSQIIWHESHVSLPSVRHMNIRITKVWYRHLKIKSGATGGGGVHK